VVAKLSAHTNTQNTCN